MTTTEAHAITVPGIYDGIPAADYHADPVPGGSLSSTGARKILPPSCPARFRWEIDNPEPPKALFDLGTAAHTLVLGTGPPIAIIDAPDWRTKAAKEAAEEAREAGQVPLLRDDYAQVAAMASALAGHPVASALFDPDRGRPEQSAFWHAGGATKRARFDWLPGLADRPERPIVTEYKTARSANPAVFGRAAANFGYHQQAAWYLEGLEAVAGLAGAIVFVVQEKAPPYLVTVCELDHAALKEGSELNKRATEIYVRCKEADEWPGYSNEVELISLPPWSWSVTEGAFE